MPDKGFGSGPSTRYIDRQGNIIDIAEPKYAAGYGSNSSSGIMSGMGGLGIGNSLGSIFSNLFGGGTTSPTSNPTPPPPPPPPTVTITALPNPVKRGQPVGVAWQSNGTSLQQPCQITATDDGRVIASANGGSQSVPTSSSTPATLTFTATCYGITGQTVVQSASVAVQ